MEHVREWLRQARSVAVLTGAGISAESGVPTFRGPGGIWRQYRPENLATPEAFARDPALVWEWYDWRRGILAGVQPNAAHRALVEFEAAKPGFTLITQNVDGLHELAGSRRVLKLHGDIWHLRCTTCGAEWCDRRVPLPELPPRCGCGSLARPAVVWFGEALPGGVMTQAFDTVREADVFLSIGTSAVVYPAAGLIPEARSAGAWGVEINVEPSACSAFAHRILNGPAGEILPRLLA